MTARDFSRLTDVEWRRSHEAENGLFIAEGAKVIERAYSLGYKPRQILTTLKWLESFDENLLALSDVFVVEDSEMQAITGYHVHRGALASFERPQNVDFRDLLSTSRSIAVLEGLVDHENVGAIFRSAAGLGIDAILITDDCADPFYRRSIKTSMGATLTLPFARIPTVASLKDHKDSYSIYGLVVGGALALSMEVMPQGKLMFMFGSEGHGLSDTAKSILDQEISIPMFNHIDSLNVAQCAAIVFWLNAQRVEG